MVKIAIDTDDDIEMIDRLIACTKEDSDIVDRILEKYDLDIRESTELLINHIFRSIKIIHKQSFIIPIILQKVSCILPEGSTKISKALLGLFSQDLLNNLENNSYKSQFYAICVRHNVFLVDDALQSIIPFVDVTPDIMCKNGSLFLFSFWVFCSDIFYDSKPVEAKKIIRVMTERGFFFENLCVNDCYLSRTICDPNAESYSDYHCLIHDNVDYIRALASDPGFDMNRAYELPIWEYRPVLTYSPSLICAAAYYGAEKCFRYLYLSEADCNYAEDPNGNNNPFWRGNRNIFGGRLYYNTMGNDYDFEKWVHSKCPPSLYDNSPNYSSSVFSQFEVCEYAIAGGNYQILRLLEQKGAKYRFPYTAAASFNRKQLFEYFLNSKLPGIQNTVSIVSGALITDNVGFIRYLIQKGYISTANVISYELTNIIGPNVMKEMIFREYGTSLLHGFLNQLVMNRIFEFPALIEYSNIIPNGITTAMLNESEDIIKLTLQKIKISLDALMNYGFSNIGLPFWRAQKKILKIIFEEELFDSLVFINNVVIDCIRYNHFENTEFVLSFSHIKTKFTVNELIKECTSIEMRQLIKKVYA